MKKGKLLLVLGLLASFVAAAAPSRAELSEPFCGDGMQSIVGYGSANQIGVQYTTFIPSFEAACKKASGLISYFSADEPTTFFRMVSRGEADGSAFDAFWTFESPLSETELAQVEGDTGRLQTRYSPVGQFPLYINGLAVAYNLSCVSTPLNLTNANLSLIYLGVITSWNDPKLVANNPGLSACNKPIKLTGRADAGGETTTFKQYLGSRNPVWEVYAQPELNTQWPSPLVCRGGGDIGAAGCVASVTGSIGYVSTLRARRSGLRVANIESVHVHQGALSAVDLSNPTGVDVHQLTTGGAPSVTPQAFVAPSSTGCTTAANSIEFPPTFDNYSDWNALSLINSTDGYPMCYFSFFDILKKEEGGYVFLPPGQRQTLRDYMLTIFSNSVQAKLAKAGYEVLPRKILDMNLRGIAQIEGDHDCSIPVSFPYVPGLNFNYTSPPVTVPTRGQLTVSVTTDAAGCVYTSF
ncbi:MAG: substrate-binding domain-containing protein [Actinomycetota bacterium]